MNINMIFLFKIQTINYIIRQPFFIGILAAFICFCYFYLNNKNKVLNKYLWIVYQFIFICSTLIFLYNIVNRIFNPGIWDFTAFYLWGKTAALDYNYYLPENLAIVNSSIRYPFSRLEMYEFYDYIVNVGFLYPPQTILLFLPLGYFSFKTSLVLWTIFNSLFVVGCIYLIFDIFFKNSKINGILLVSILLFSLKPSLSTMYFSQTNFILLFLLLLVWKYSENMIGGIFLALAFLVKPYMIIFLIVFFLRKKWKAILYFITSILFFVGITFILFGKEIFTSYIFNNPSLRLPDDAFSEEVNQSLNAVLIRNNIIASENTFAYISLLVGIIIITGIYFFFLSKRKLYDYIWATLLLVGLLIYPGTLIHYGTLLLFIIFQFFNKNNQLGINWYYVPILIGIFYFLSTFSVFTAITFLLGIVMIKSFFELKQREINTKSA